MVTSNKPKLIVGMSGSSAPQYGICLLRALRDLASVEVHLVMTDGARLTIKCETDEDPDDILALADVVHDCNNLAASISSGSFKTIGMAVVPCSMRTLAAIATGNSSDLLCRAADVCLKERRRLVLATRETPLNLIHVRNMETVILAGGTICPPIPAFYHRPKTIEDLIAQSVGKILDQFEIGHDLFERWS
jgi:polyprenyl P-hydroxybenzoate/phenylacrylic acid decarboxylase-like protein